MGLSRTALPTALVALILSCCEANVDASVQQGQKEPMASLIASLSKTLVAVLTGSAFAVIALLMERGMTTARPSKLLPDSGRTADMELPPLKPEVRHASPKMYAKPTASPQMKPSVSSTSRPAARTSTSPLVRPRSQTSSSEVSNSNSPKSDTSNSPKETPKSCSPLSALTKGLSEEQLVERQVKSILNKLTWEKFDTLYVQLLSHCKSEKAGMCTTAIQVIASDLFKKATTQHNFIELYADVCARLELDLKDLDSDGSFRRSLLEQCQDSFTKHLQPPEVNKDLEYEEQYEELVKYKTKMIGNVRFIGHLLKLRMLAAKILFCCVDELMSIGSPEALETLCALLETVGSTLDKADWAGHDRLQKVFQQVELLASDSKQSSRIRCLLKDLLDKRAKRWTA